MEKHAYLIIAHQQPRLLRTLLRAVDDARNAVFLFIDQRSEALYEEFSHHRLRHASFHVLEQRFPIYWGDLSQVRAEYALFEAALAAGSFAYHHLLSGACLPLKSQDEIHRFCRQHQGQEFVTYWSGAAHKRDLRRKVAYHYFFNRYYRDKHTWGHRLTSPLRNISLAAQKMVGYRRPHGTYFRKGSNWVSLTREACLHLMEHKQGMLQRLRRTCCPDEIFVQTLLWHSPFRHRLYLGGHGMQSSLRAIDWERGAPYVWQPTDWPALTASPALFGRKFADGPWLDHLFPQG